MRRQPTNEELKWLDNHFDLKIQLNPSNYKKGIVDIYDLSKLKENHPFYGNQVIVFDDGSIEDCSISPIEYFQIDL